MQNGNVLFVDFDDTLHPTSYLARVGVRAYNDRTPEPLESAMQQYSKALHEFFTVAIAHASVYIITCAAAEWVTGRIRTCCSRETVDDLAKIRIIPCRRGSRKRRPHEEDILEWKLSAIRIVLEQHVHNLRNVVSLGDGMAERDATLKARNLLSATLLYKSVKFEMWPTLTSLTTELQLITSYLPKIIEYHEDLDLQLRLSAGSGTGGNAATSKCDGSAAHSTEAAAGVATPVDSST